MRRVANLFFLLVVLALGACGMGSTSLDGTSSGAHMYGSVLSVDGDSTNLAKVSVAAPDLGVLAFCDEDGRFDLGDVPAMPMRMHVQPDDGGAAIETWVDLADCREMEIRIVVEDGRIVRAYLEHCGDHHGAQVWEEMHDAMHVGGGVAMDHGGMHGAGDMHSGAMHGGGMTGDGGMMGGGGPGMPPAPGAAGPSGEVGMHQDGAGHMGFALAIEGLTAGTEAEVTLIHPDGTRLSLGTYTVDAQGRLLADWDAQDGLPFGARHVRELAGATVEVVDVATGALLLSGTLPDVGDMGPHCDQTTP